jgi:hypothetical protein
MTHDTDATRCDFAYKGLHEARRVNIGAPLSTNLVAALRAYHSAFGHEVPADIVDKYAGRCGPLMLEIRQAVALGRPVEAWLARSKLLTALTTLR